jgi:hypothetical protein
MATKVLTNAGLTINGSDLSDHVKSVKVTYDVDQAEDTAMGATVHTFKPGLIKLKIEVTYFQDRASGKVEYIHFPLVGSQTGFIIVIKDDKTTPLYTYTASSMQIAEGYNPLAADVGAMEMTTVSYNPMSGCTFLRT